MKEMHKIKIFVGIVVVFFSGTFLSTEVYANASSDFKWIKNIAIEESQLIHLGIYNQEFLIFIYQKDQNSGLIQLGLKNQRILLKKTKNKEVLLSSSSQLLYMATKYATMDIWAYLEPMEDRKKGIDEYLFRAQSILGQSQSSQKFLKESLLDLKKTIGEQEEQVQKVKVEFQESLSLHNKEKIESTKQKFLSENKHLEELKAEYVEKKYTYKSFLSPVKNLTQKISAIKANYDALEYGIKTQKKSGEVVGVIE